MKQTFQSGGRGQGKTTFTMDHLNRLLAAGKIRGIIHKVKTPIVPTAPPMIKPDYESGPKVEFTRALRALCKERGWPLLEEQRFDIARKWRIDFVITGHRPIAIEYEGIYSADANRNGHQGQKHYEKDVEKYNAVAIAGLLLLRCTAKSWQPLFELLKNMPDGNRTC